MYKKILYKKAYRLLADSTPLKFDCGLLCNRKCCSGDSNTGMCLFPGEEEMFDRQNGFLKMHREKLSDGDVLFGVCDGTCKRKYRPLSCRIYPYVPYMDDNGKLTIIEDPRARYLCPLLIGSTELKINKIFKRNIRDAFFLLIQDSDIKRHICLLSGIIDEYGRFVR
jgi:hypothetical protein